jgi:hypothetical protein
MGPPGKHPAQAVSGTRSATSGVWHRWASVVRRGTLEILGERLDRHLQLLEHREVLYSGPAEGR